MFDDGQYGVSVVDMRHGLAPYTGVFSSQGPLHYPLLFAGDLLGFRTLDAPRLTPLLAGVAASIGVWAIARRLGASPGVALVAGLLLATSGTMLWATGQVTGDGPAVAIMVWAVWAACRYRDEPSTGRAVLTGVLVGAALAVKPLVGTALGPRRLVDVVAPARARPRRRRPAAAVAVWFAAALPWGLGRVWDQSITYHTGKGPEYTKLFQLGKLTSLVPLRDGIVVVAVVLGLIATLVGASTVRTRRGRRGRRGGVARVRRVRARVREGNVREPSRQRRRAARAAVRGAPAAAALARDRARGRGAVGVVEHVRHVLARSTTGGSTPRSCATCAASRPARARSATIPRSCGTPACRRRGC